MLSEMNKKIETISDVSTIAQRQNNMLGVQSNQNSSHRDLAIKPQISFGDDTQRKQPSDDVQVNAPLLADSKTDEKSIGTTFLTKDEPSGKQANSLISVQPFQMAKQEDDKKAMDIQSESSYRDDFESSIAGSDQFGFDASMSASGQFPNRLRNNTLKNVKTTDSMDEDDLVKAGAFLHQRV